MASLDFDMLFDSFDMGISKEAMSPTDSMPSPTMAEIRPSDQAMSVDGSESDRSLSSGASDAGDTSDAIPEAEVARVRDSKVYSLRQSSIINRIETERRQRQPKQTKPKIKPAPLSKYRRRTANARERGRMKEINDAFETLRLSIPNYPIEKNNKLTKITTLRLAMNYISALRDMLDNSEDYIAETDTAQQELSSGQNLNPPSNVEVTNYSGIAASPSSLTDFPHQSPEVFPSPSLLGVLPHQDCLPS